KKNLYLKTDPQLSKYMGIKDKKNIPPKVEAMFRYVKDWGWNINKITEMDNFDNWDFNQVMAFWDLVRKFMLLCYQRISLKLPALNSGKKIPESDILLLSRKIKTHFRKEKDKIEQFITFKDTPSESVLYLEPVSQGIRDLEWRLYKRNTSEKESFKTTTLKIEKNLINIVVWVSLNRIYDPVISRFNLQSGYTRINQPQVINLMNQISEFFKFDLIKIRNDHFLNPPFNFLNFIIINFDTENAEEIKNLYYLYHTSWGESFLKEYKSEADLSEILFTILKDGLKFKKSYDDFCAINTPDPYKKPYKPVISNFKEAYTAIVEGSEDRSARYLMRLADRFIMYTRHGNTVEKEEFQNIFNLLATISLKPKRRFEYKFSTAEPVFSVLNAVHEFSKKYSITIAYEEKGNILVIYVVNEKGNMFTFFKPAKQSEDYLVNMYDFCQNITKRVKGVDVFSEIDRGGIGVQYFKTDRFGNVSVTDDSQQIRGQWVLKHGRHNSLTMSVAKHKAAEPLYNIIFPDMSSTGFIPVKSMGTAAQKIIALKKAGQLFDSIIRDLVFSDLTKEENELGSTLYFIEKYKIESIFDKLIKK
ncbi:MAG: class I adenylate cyclase, partial [Spirochaetes bacterium]|nr:class I adenylate cyclase [Spirochaetota bacterium]